MIAISVLAALALGSAAPTRAAVLTKAASGPEPAASEPSLTIQLPVKVKGKLPKSSKGRLIGRLEAAVAGARAEGGPYRVRMSVGLARKKDYTLTLTVVGADDQTLVELSEPCKGCSVGQAGDTVAALVQRVVEELEAQAKAPGEVTVTSEPAGATVSVDGKEQGPTPQTLALSPGEHTVVVTKPGFGEQRQTVEVQPRSTQQLALTLEAVAAAPQPAAGSDDEGSKDKRSKKDKKDKVVHTGPRAGKPWTIAGGVVLGLGVAGVLAGVAMVLIDEDPIPSKCEGDQVDFRGVCRVRYDTLTGGIVGLAAGAVGIGGGIALMVKGRLVTVKARASETQASVGVGLRF